MTGPVVPRLDPILELAQVEPLNVCLDQARRMIFPDQAVDIHRAQLDLVAFGLAQARRTERCRIGLRFRLLREFSKQLVCGHRCLLRINDRTESQLAPHQVVRDSVAKPSERFTGSQGRRGFRRRRQFGHCAPPSRSAAVIH